MNTLNQLLQGVKNHILTIQSQGKRPFVQLHRARLVLAMLIPLTPFFQISSAAANPSTVTNILNNTRPAGHINLQTGSPEAVQPVNSEQAGDETNPPMPDPSGLAQAGYRYFMPAIAKGRLGSGDWAMAAANPSRNSWTAEEVKGSLRPVWYKHFSAYISQKTQIIAANNSLYISTSAGLYALDASSGNERWFYATQLPLGHSPTFYNGVVYVGGFDKKIHAVNASNGQGLWTFEAGAGFQTNPLIVEGKLFAGNRDGFFYAISVDGPQAGQLAWKFKTDAPVLYSAAYKDGVVYFASNDNYAYALRAADGQQVWKSNKLPGHGFHSWWPVVHEDWVVFAGSYNYRYNDPFPAPHTTLEMEVYPSGGNPGEPVGLEGTEPGSWLLGTKTVTANSIAQYFEKNPHRRTYFVLNRANGQEHTYDSDGDGNLEYAPILWFGTHSGTRYPPVVGPDGVLYQSNHLSYDTIPRGKISGWKIGTPIVSSPSGSGAAIDEPLAYSVGGNTIYWKHCCDRSAGAFEVFNSSGTASDLENWSYYDEGGNMLRRTLPDLFQKGWNFAYWKHGDQSPPIPYQGKVYLIANNAVVAFGPGGKGPVLPSNENVGKLSGEKPQDIEREQVITGLNTKVTQGNSTWPLLIQQENYYNTDTQPDSRGLWFRLLEVAGASAGDPDSLNSQPGEISTLLTSTFGGHVLKTRISQRSPTSLFETDSDQYQLRGKLVGMAYPSGGGVQVRTGSATVNGADLSAGWLLVWDSTETHRWSPLVVSLQRRPNQIDFSANGLQLSFSGPAGFLAVTPLYGMSAPKSDEVNTWPAGLPAEITGRVQLLDRLARAYPESASESWSIDGSSGDANITYSYNYIEFSGDWGTPPLRLAYLPAHIALAAWNGSPIRSNGLPLEQLLDLGYVTPLGRVAGAPDTNSVKVTLPGIAGYWRNSPDQGAGAPGDPLRGRLVAEVQKMLNAGHLLPGYGMVGIWESRSRARIGDHLSDYWKNPADTVYTLLRALPLLPPEIQEQVKAYVQNEFNSYPLYTSAHIGWEKGANREWFDLPPEVEAARGAVMSSPQADFNGWGLPPQNIYALWMYANQFGNASQYFKEVQSRLDLMPRYRNSLPYVLNSYISGYIGYLRLAQLAGAGPQTEAEKTMVHLLMNRAALSKYPNALKQTGFEYGSYEWTLRQYAPNRADTLFNATVNGSLWSQMPLYGHPIDLRTGLAGAGMGGDYAFAIDFVNLVPEAASFMRTYARNEAEAMVGSYSHRAPHWFVAKAEEGGGEAVFQSLYDQVSIFQARAMVLQQSRGELEKYLDVPAVRVGDLFYIQNLISTLQAAR